MNALTVFLIDDLYPRKNEIVTHPNFVICIVFFLISTFLVYNFNFISDYNGIGGFINFLIGYSSIEIGFSVTALTSTLGVLDNFKHNVLERIMTLSASDIPNKKEAYNKAVDDLIFLYTWSAVCHVFLLALLLGLNICLEAKNFHFLYNLRPYYTVLCFSFSLYCFLQWLSTILALNSFSKLYHQFSKME